HFRVRFERFQWPAAPFSILSVLPVLPKLGRLIFLRKREQSSGVILKNTIMPKQACQEIVDSPVDGLGLDPAPSPLSETPGDLINRIPYNGLKKSSLGAKPAAARRG